VTLLQPDQEPLHRRAGRPRIVPALCLWAGMLVCILKGCSRQLDLWRRLSLYGLWSYPLYDVTDQAIYKRLAGGQSGAGGSGLLRLCLVRRTYRAGLLVGVALAGQNQ
jgi:hypothetical protein